VTDRLADHLSYIARGVMVENESFSVTLLDRRNGRQELRLRPSVGRLREVAYSEQGAKPGVVLKVDGATDVRQRTCGLWADAPSLNRIATKSPENDT
jgi:hypothetical protein